MSGRDDWCSTTPFGTWPDDLRPLTVTHDGADPCVVALGVSAFVRFCPRMSPLVERFRRDVAGLVLRPSALGVPLPLLFLLHLRPVVSIPPCKIGPDRFCHGGSDPLETVAGLN